MKTLIGWFIKKNFVGHTSPVGGIGICSCMYFSTTFYNLLIVMHTSLKGVERGDLNAFDYLILLKLQEVKKNPQVLK